jgi:hypothetical protein
MPSAHLLESRSASALVTVVGMPRLRPPVALLIGGALALALTACGSATSNDTAGADGTATSAPGTPSTPIGSSPAPSNSGIVPANTWASVFKKALPPIADTRDEDVVTAAQKVCTTFEATPDEATAKAILADLGASLALDATQQQVFASGAVTHFCTGSADDWTRASIG